MKTYEEAKLEVQKRAVMCGGVSHIDKKELKSDGINYYLDGKKVIDPVAEVFSKVEVEETAIMEEMSR